MPDSRAVTVVSDAHSEYLRLPETASQCGETPDDEETQPAGPPAFSSSSLPLFGQHAQGQRSAAPSSGISRLLPKMHRSDIDMQSPRSQELQGSQESPNTPDKPSRNVLAVRKHDGSEVVEETFNLLHGLWRCEPCRRHTAL